MNILDRFCKLWANEPVVVIGLVETGMLLLVGFGVPIDGKQQLLVLGAVKAAGMLISRLQVTPNGKAGPQ